MLDTTRAAAWYRIQSVLAASTAGVIGSLWDNIDPDNIASSWRAQLPLATDAVAYGSRRAASGSSAYVAATIADEGVDPLNVTINVSRLVSRPVTSARLAVPMLRTLERIGRGDSVTESLASGRLLATLSVSRRSPNRVCMVGSATWSPRPVGDARSLPDVSTPGPMDSHATPRATANIAASSTGRCQPRAVRSKVQHRTTSNR